MKKLRILLILTLLVVTGLYGFSTVSLRLLGSDIGPVLTCDSDTLDVSVSDGESVLLQGVTAKDKQDGDLTGNILISSISKMVGGSARVNYLVFDSDNNVGSLTRTIRYTDYVPPRFQVLEPLVYAANEPVALLDRLLVEDVLDGDITGSVRVSYLTETDIASVYTVDLQVTNSAGDTARVSLPIIRQDNRYRGRVVLDSYLIYLEQGASFNPRSHLTRVELGSGIDETRGDTQDVAISGTVDTSKPGCYHVIYTYHQDNTVIQSALTVVVE